MPPRPRDNEPIGGPHHVDPNADSTTPTDAAALKPKREETVPPKSPPTMHWELNLYTALVLGGLYYSFESTRYPIQLFLTFMALDAARYYWIKQSMPGVVYTPPLVSLLAMVFHPVRFWAELAHVAMNSSDGMCSTTLLGKFMIFVTDPQVCREVLTGEGRFNIYAHPNAKWLFGPKNLIYLPTQIHKQFRAILSPALFSTEALTLYAQAQQGVCRKFLQRIATGEFGTPTDVRIAFRSMAAAASQESFLGPYLTDDMRHHFEQDILTFTLGFLCFPFPYLFGLAKAIRAKNRIEATIHTIVPQAREYVLKGNKPRCMMEFWIQSILQAAKEQGVDPEDVPCCGTDDIARTVLDFLFAAQDATNSALAYALDVLEAYPDVVDKMRHEIQETLQDSDNDDDIWTLIHGSEAALPYTHKVANQLLHHKPPVPMIPHLCLQTTTLKNGYTIPKGAVIIPSISYAARVTGSTHVFEPERPDPDSLFVKTVTFGGGQHKCPGRRYAESLLTVFLAVLVPHYEFARTGPRPHEDDFIYFPTLFPSDNHFVIRPRGDGRVEI